MPRSLLDTAEAVPRQRNGTITTFWTSMSFMRMNSAARFTGSISVSAALYIRSYSSLRQRVEFRPAHLLSFWAISHDTNGCMNSWGSGEPLTRLYICRSAEKCARVSALAGSVEKYTAGTIAFTSSSIPILAAACLTMAWVFWRGALIEVWKTMRRRLSPFARRPSPDRRHPASSSTFAAFSGLNSHRVFRDRNAGGALR